VISRALSVRLMRSKDVSLTREESAQGGAVTRHAFEPTRMNLPITPFFGMLPFNKVVTSLQEGHRGSGRAATCIA
jgi:hypothetical protein